MMQVFKEIEYSLDKSIDEVFEREHDPFTVNEDLVHAVDKVSPRWVV